MISASRAGERLSPFSRSLIASLNSGMVDPGDAADRFHELAPAFALRRQDLFARGSEPVITAPALSGLLDPAPADPTAFFQPVKQRIKRCHIEPQCPARTHLDELSDVIAMP